MNSLETLGETAAAYKRVRDHVTELEKALESVEAGVGDGKLNGDLRCSISLSSGQVDFRASRGVLAPLIKAELERESQALARLQRKIDAAVVALQQQS